ncbi:hypothetical protein IL306_012803 [Fusarium sp. DS 682]|nr:hypothetical protein IL306_012803 [Fusarium sp. DS 682]
MAHYADQLPWKTLASVFELRRTNPCQHGAYNLHARTQPESRTKVDNFVKAFMQRLSEDAALQRKNYPEKYEVPNENEVIVSDEAAARIEPTVRRWHPEEHWPDGDSDLKTFKQPTTGKLCPHTGEADECGCVLPFRERKMSAFQRYQVQNDCYEFEEYNKESFRNLEVVKSLILHGEMDAVLRSCAYQECQLAKWWEHRECMCMPATLGWRRIYEYGINMYMLFNILRFFPETWDDNGSPIDDYRDLKAYQKAVRLSTESGHRSEIPTYPHVDLFGIEEGQFRCYPRPFDVPRWKHIMKFDKWDYERYQKGLSLFDDSDDSDDESDAKSGDDSSMKSGKKSDKAKESDNNSEDGSSDDSSGESEEEDPEVVKNRFYKLEFYPYGLISYEDFLNFEKPMGYQPNPSDISHVRWILCQQGLPVEISDGILEYANYAPKGSLPVPGKPLHPQCKQELDRYLKHCWQLIVRCYMLGRELDGRDNMDIDINVLDEVKDCFMGLFKCGCDGVYEVLYDFDGEPEPTEDSETDN